MEEENLTGVSELATGEKQSMGNFVKLSIEEVSVHTTWPSRIELISQSLAVLVASLLFALVIGGADLGFEALMKFIYSFS